MTPAPMPNPHPVNPPADGTRIVYYVRNDSTGEIVRKKAVVPTLPNDRLGGTIYGFATEREYLDYLATLRTRWQWLSTHATTQADAAEYLHCALELARAGWVLNEAQTDWQPKEADNGTQTD